MSQWSRVMSQCSMVNAQWSRVKGQGSMVNAHWTLDFGLWTLDFGLLTYENWLYENLIFYSFMAIDKTI